jgi:NAD(P)H-hydrate epimerase
MSDFPFNPNSWNAQALLTCAEMRRAEKMTFAQGVPGFSLMQRAGETIAELIQKKWKRCRVLALCGPGNNAGDGFIAAESLRAAAWDVTVAAMRMPEDLSGDAAQAAKNWKGKTTALEDSSFDGVDLVIDALFGTGLTKPIDGVARTAIEKLARTKIPVIAVDLPSGVNSDTGAIMNMAPHTTFTVTFFRKKIGHALLPGAKLCGEILVADIGIKDDVLDEIRPKTAENHSDLWLDQFPFPQPEGHKYTRGHVLIAGGAVMTGATRLAARAAQRVGAGLVTLTAPQSAISIYAEALESVIVRPADTLDAWRELLADEKRNALLIGPGLGLGKTQKDFVLAALKTRKACVLDADALSNFAEKPDTLFSKLHPHCVLTPHEGEFARLFGARVDPKADKLTRARRAAEIAGCIVLLKGADTVIADPEGFAIINVNAPPSLAVAGAGDVLAGIITGLLAQNMHVFMATAAASWIHGLAATQFGPGLIAEDLIAGIPPILKGLSENAGGVL